MFLARILLLWADDTPQQRERAAIAG